MSKFIIKDKHTGASLELPEYYDKMIETTTKAKMLNKYTGEEFMIHADSFMSLCDSIKEYIGTDTELIGFD